MYCTNLIYLEASVFYKVEFAVFTCCFLFTLFCKKLKSNPHLVGDLCGFVRCKDSRV